MIPDPLPSDGPSDGAPIEAASASATAARQWLPAVSLSCALAAILIVRSLRWPIGVSSDGWAYTAWGRALLHGQVPDPDASRTSFKPLSTLLGLLVAPFPPGRGLEIAAALCAAALVGVVFEGVRRDAGALGALLVVGLWIWLWELDRIVYFGLVDVVGALLVAGAVLARAHPRGRLALLLAAGLLRPEAWPIAAFAAYRAASGRRLRRLVLAVAAGLAPLAVFMLSLWLASGDALYFLHAPRAQESSGWRAGPLVIVRQVLSAVGSEASWVLLALGAAGLVLGAVQARRRGTAWDPLAAVAVVVWIVAMVAEVGDRYPALPRYTMAAAAVLVMSGGPALRAARLPRIDARWAAYAAAVLLVCIAAARVTAGVSLGPDIVTVGTNRAIAAAAPAVAQAARCGVVYVAPHDPRTASPLRGWLITELAAESGLPLSAFASVSSAGDGAVLVESAPGEPGGPPVPAGWPGVRLPAIGEVLAVRPGCAVTLAGLPGTAPLVRP